MVRLGVGTCIAPLFVLALCADLAAGGPDDDGPETLAEQALESFEQALDDYELDDVQEALTDFDTVYDKVSERARRKIDKAVEALLDQRPRAAVPGEALDPRSELLPCYQLAVGLIYDKEEGRKILVSALKAKHVTSWDEVRGLIVEGLGYRREPDNIAVFADHLTDAGSATVAAAAEALGRYDEQDVELRRKAVRELVEAYLEHHKAAEKEARRKSDEQPAKDLLAAVEGAFERSLTSLTRQSFDDAPSWDAWWREHGAESDW